MGWRLDEKDIYLCPRITCIHMHTIYYFPFSIPPWTNLPLSGFQALTRPHATPAISPRFLGSQDRVLIELLFLLKIIKSDSRPDPGAWTRFPSRRVFIPGRFILSLISTATFPSPSLFFFSAGPRSRSRPGPSCIVHLPALLPSHDVLTCYASASPRAYAYRSASDRSEAAEHYRGRNSNPVAEQA